MDVDGVLADFLGSALRIVNDMLNTKHLPSDVAEFDFCRSLGIDSNDAANIKRRIGSTPGFARSIAVLPGAKRGVIRLREVADVYVVTAPWNSNSTWTSEREGWLDQHFGIPYSRVVHTSAKHVCAGDVLVDDRTETLERWQAAHPCGIAVQWETSSNRLDGWNGQSTNDWDVLVNIVTGQVAP